MKKVPPAEPASWREFGNFLFDCREADPGYYVLDYLRQEGYDINQRMRFAVAWCTFYNLGLAAQASELKSGPFYKFLHGVYPTAKRASERRHFRGQAGLVAIERWTKQFPAPEWMVRSIFNMEILHGTDKDKPKELTMGTIRTNCESVPQMGDYFKWKWGDLAEVLFQVPVVFRGWENKSPKVPQQGAALIAKEADREHYDTQKIYRIMARDMRSDGVKSPYAGDFRDFDVQDAETICCVYKQYRSGGYVPGLRTAKAYARLTADGGGCQTAKDAVRLLLAKQPRREFRGPVKLATILNGEGKPYTVGHFL